MIESNKFEIFFIEGMLYSELQNCFLGILEENQNYLSKNILEKVLDQIIESKKETNLTVIGMITYYYSKIVPEKFEITDNLSEYFSKNEEEIKLCFLRLFEEQIKKKEIEKIKAQLKTNFNLNIYTRLLKFDYIDFDLELEDKIIPYLDLRFSKELGSSNYNSILYEIFSIYDNNKISQELKEKLKNYNNPYFLNYLKKNNLENDWNYFVAKENFDYSKFTIENLKSFTKYGVEKIISEGKNNKEFMKLIYDYLNSNTNNHIFKGYFNYSFKEIKDLDR